MLESLSRDKYQEHCKVSPDNTLYLHLKERQLPNQCKLLTIQFVQNTHASFDNLIMASNTGLLYRGKMHWNRCKTD